MDNLVIVFSSKRKSKFAMELTLSGCSIKLTYYGREYMSKADKIRGFVLENYVKPARERGENEITIRAGDIHKVMGLRDSMPAVASALGAQKFENFARVKLIKREGPHNGANLRFTFQL